MTNIQSVLTSCNSKARRPMPGKRVRLQWILTLLVLASVCLLTSCGEPSRQDIFQKELGDKIDSYIHQVMDKFDIPGMTIAITQEGKTIYTGAFGVRNLNTQEPMKPEYPFHMASVSKPFAATAIMQLVEQGRMKLDEKVITYLPYFELADERYKDITIRQMLNHKGARP